MKTILIFLFLSLTLLAGEKVEAQKKPQTALQELSKHAIRVGTGEGTTVYVFLDPLCSFSRTLMKQIDQNKMLQLTNSYYIFLYRLPRLDSEKTMQFILESKDKKETLLDVMVRGEVLNLDDFTPKEESIKILKEISAVAQTLDMKLRPYMISFEKDSKYCRVSEGSASCLEELE